MKAHQLSLSIDGKQLLSDISFSVPSSSIFVILGPNGAGKTLLLRLLAGLNAATDGFVEYPEKELAWVPLSQPLPFAFRVMDLIVMGRFAKHQGFPGKTDEEVSIRAMARVGITGFRDRPYNNLSRGEQTRVDIARAIASEAPLILLDEPFSNLDIDACLQMITLFRDLRDEGRTLILSHHDLYSARDLATHGLLLKKGRVLRHGPIAEIFKPEAIQEAYNVKPVMIGDKGLRFEKL